METARIVHTYAEVLAWPLVAILAIILYRDVASQLLPGSKVKFTISGVTIETTVAVLGRSVSESLRGRDLSREQWAWLEKLRPGDRIPYNHTYYDQLRPLRNSGLIREHPEGWLSNAAEIEITTLGKLLIEARGQRAQTSA